MVAALRPDLIKKLVVVEASPGPIDDKQADEHPNETIQQVERWLQSWPSPFPSREAAIRFFGRNDNWANAWADGLEQRADGFYPSFDIDVMIKTLEAADGSYWNEWRSIRCPVLLVVAKDRDNPRLTQRMLEDQPKTSLVEIPNAGHDLHLDNPDDWRAALEGFL